MYVFLEQHLKGIQRKLMSILGSLIRGHLDVRPWALELSLEYSCAMTRWDIFFYIEFLG